MKINISAEIEGPEVVQEYVLQRLVSSPVGAIDANDIKLMVQNKEDKWVPFDVKKIKFIYTN